MTENAETSPKRISKRHAVDTQSSYSVFNGVKRIRQPHPHDVLSGRGGGINAHPGNIHFRDWVSERKNAYNLAPTKSDKARVAREVIDLVTKEQDPPGRFLIKDPSTTGHGASWWIELDDEKVMAKTSQALREGAPQIRAAHKDELEALKSVQSARRARTRKSAAQQRKREDGEMDQVTAAQKQAMEELRRNAEAAAREKMVLDEEFQRPEKRVRLENNGKAVLPSDDVATPPLTPVPATHDLQEDEEQAHILPPPVPPKNNAGAQLQRAHSLALSDMGNGSEWMVDEFVDPFADESDIMGRHQNTNNNRPQPGLYRESSTASNGDMAGLGTLLRNESKLSNNSSGVRSRNSLGNVSSRYDPATWDDDLLFDAMTDYDWDVTPVSP